MRQIPAIVFKHIQRQFVTSLILNVFRYTAFFSTHFIFAPLFWKIQTLINQSMFLTRGVAHVNTHLAVVHLTQSPQPLMLNAHRVMATFFEPRRVKNDDAIFFTDLSTYLSCQFLLQWLMVPGSKTDKPLQGPTILVVPVGKP